MAHFASTDMTSATQAHKPALRDVIVIGGSAGGLESLRAVLRGLRQDLPAALFVVLHMGDVSHLAQALEVDSPVPVLNAESGQSIKSGRLYVAMRRIFRRVRATRRSTCWKCWFDPIRSGQR